MNHELILESFRRKHSAGNSAEKNIPANFRRKGKRYFRWILNWILFQYSLLITWLLQKKTFWVRIPFQILWQETLCREIFLYCDWCRHTVMKMYILILLRIALKKRNKFVKNNLSIEYSLSKHTIILYSPGNQVIM